MGEEDQGANPAVPFPIVESNREFDAAARQAGYDAELIVVLGGQLDPITPGTEQFATWVETVARTANGVG